MKIVQNNIYSSEYHNFPTISCYPFTRFEHCDAGFEMLDFHVLKRIVQARQRCYCERRRKRDRGSVCVRPGMPTGYFQRIRTKTITAPDPHEHNHIPNVHHRHGTLNQHNAPDPLQIHSTCALYTRHLETATLHHSPDGHFLTYTNRTPKNIWPA